MPRAKQEKSVKQTERTLAEKVIYFVVLLFAFLFFIGLLNVLVTPILSKINAIPCLEEQSNSIMLESKCPIYPYGKADVDTLYFLSGGADTAYVYSYFLLMYLIVPVLLVYGSLNLYKYIKKRQAEE